MPTPMLSEHRSRILIALNLRAPFQCSFCAQSPISQREKPRHRESLMSHSLSGTEQGILTRAKGSQNLKS